MRDLGFCWDWASSWLGVILFVPSEPVFLEAGVPGEGYVKFVGTYPHNHLALSNALPI